MLDVVPADKQWAEELFNCVSSYRIEVARQRSRLRRTWRSASEPVDVLQAQSAALQAALDQRAAELASVVSSFSVQPEGGLSAGPLPSDPLDWLARSGSGTWMLRPNISSAFSKDYETARLRMIEASNRSFGGRARRVAALALGDFSAWLSALREAKARLDGDLATARAGRSQQAAQERAASDRALAAAADLSQHALRRLAPALQPWASPAWSEMDSESATFGLGRVYAGELIPMNDADLGENADIGSSAQLPFFITLSQNLQLVYDTSNRSGALGLARSMLLRQLAATAPGDLQFCLFDPVGLGQSVGDLLDLAEYDASLIGGKVWSSASDLAARLTEQTSHIELVIQKYLRSTYATIDDFNAAAGEIAEPYRLLVLFDFPAAFSEETLRQLKSIVQNGPRCGLFVLLLHNASTAAPYGVDLSLLAGDTARLNFGSGFALRHRDYTMQCELHAETDAALPSAVARQIIDTVGRRSASRGEAAVSFPKVFGLYADEARRGIHPGLSMSAAATVADDDSTWWQDSSTTGLRAPVGQKGARGVAVLAFDSSDHAGALLVGRPGSGKSTLLHAYIGGLTTLYGPDELELYLIDFKEGVEFKSYAAEGLPHARVVAIESDREFGLSVLQSLQAELSRRGELLRATGGKQAGMQALRESTGEVLPRLLLVFDEFQVLFARNDKVGLAAADLLETLIRQGRGFGIHILLGSQSLSGLDALGAHVPQLLPTRILLPATELDGRRVLGDNNDAGLYLTTHGEGILNPAGGAPEANERFKGALLSEDDRLDRLRRLRAKADHLGFARLPVVFEGNASAALDATPAAVFREELASSGIAPVRLRYGSPMTIGRVADIELRREAGGNVLAVLRDPGTDGAGLQPSDGPAYGVLTAALAAAATSGAQIDVIDFMPVDDGLDETLEPLLARGRITLRRRRAFAAFVQETAAEVRSRVDEDDAGRPARLLFLFGIHRARELDSGGGLDGDAELSDALEFIMRDGPEVGVHTWLWADTVSGAARRLSSRMMRECSWRIAGKLSGDDSLALLGNEVASELRDRQLLLSNDDLGVLTRAMTFAVPATGWLTEILADPATTHLGQ